MSYTINYGEGLVIQQVLQEQLLTNCCKIGWQKLPFADHPISNCFNRPTIGGHSSCAGLTLACRNDRVHLSLQLAFCLQLFLCCSLFKNILQHNINEVFVVL